MARRRQGRRAVTANRLARFYSGLERQSSQRRPRIGKPPAGQSAVTAWFLRQAVSWSDIGRKFDRLERLRQRIEQFRQKFAYTREDVDHNPHDLPQHYFQETGVVESKKPGYIQRIMDAATAKALRAAAAYLGVSVSDLPIAVRRFKEGQAQVTGREGDGATDANARPQVVEDFTVLRRKATLDALKRDWSNPSLSPDDRRKLARHLVQTYNRVRERDRDFRDDSPELKAARSIVNRANYQRRVIVEASP